MQNQTSTGEARRWKDIVVLGFASVFYLGYAPVASGTVGSLPGVFVALWLQDKPTHLLLLAIPLFILGVAAAGETEQILGVKDPSEVTIDEFVGMIVAFLWLPTTWRSAVLVFVLYRAFDVFKPFPARRCERMAGGLGIMTDDIVAGIYANVASRVIMLVFSWLS